MLDDSMNSFASITTVGSADFSLRSPDVGGDMTYSVSLTHSVIAYPVSYTHLTLPTKRIV